MNEPGMMILIGVRWKKNVNEVLKTSTNKRVKNVNWNFVDSEFYRKAQRVVPLVISIYTLYGEVLHILSTDLLTDNCNSVSHASVTHHL